MRLPINTLPARRGASACGRFQDWHKCGRGRALLQGRFRGSRNDLVDAFEIGRATERERLQLLLQTRRSLLTSNGGSNRAVSEIDTILKLVQVAQTPLDDRLAELAQQFNVSRDQVIARAIGAA